MSDLLPIITDHEFKTCFCHPCRYLNGQDPWPRETILLLKYEEQSGTGTEGIAQGVEDVAVAADDRTRTRMMNPFPFIPQWIKYNNETNSHAENEMLKKLREKVKRWRICKAGEAPLKKIILKIYLSYSPCNECSERLLEFKKDVENKNVGFEMTVKIANFYMIFQEENVIGLCSLLSKGIQLEVFQGKQDWVEFLGNIGIEVRGEWSKVLDRRFEESGRTDREYADKAVLEGLKSLTFFLIPSPLLEKFMQFCPRRMKEKLMNF